MKSDERGYTSVQQTETLGAAVLLLQSILLGRRRRVSLNDQARGRFD